MKYRTHNNLVSQHRRWSAVLASIVAKLDYIREADAATLQSLYIHMYERCSLLKRLIGNPKFQELAMQLHIKDRFVSNVTCNENSAITYSRAKQRFISLFKEPALLHHSPITEVSKLLGYINKPECIMFTLKSDNMIKI